MTASPRPGTKLSSDQQRLLAAARQAAREFHAAQLQADTVKEAAWKAILDARIGGVTDELLCNETGFSRATLHRRYGSRAAGTPAGSESVESE